MVRIETAWNGKKAPFAKMDSNYDHRLVQVAPRTDVKPLDIVQPEGASFTVTSPAMPCQLSLILLSNLLGQVLCYMWSLTSRELRH